jgi:hypothetical protein
MFFSHNKLANNIFKYNFSDKWTYCYRLKRTVLVWYFTTITITTKITTEGTNKHSRIKKGPDLLASKEHSQNRRVLEKS